MKKKQLLGNGILFFVSIIWGVAFVAQSAGLEHVGPWTINSVRFFLGFIALLPVIAVMDADKKRRGTWQKPTKAQTKTLLAGGLCCGLALAFASSLQQTALLYTTVDKAGFITALYILFVPIIGLFMKKKVHPLLWLGVALAIGGLYLLCMREGLSLNPGDLMLLGCAVLFSVHILLADHFSPRVDGVKLSALQFLVCGLVCAVPMLVFEKPSAAAILQAWLPIGYAGIMSSGVAYTLQIVGQKYTEPAVGSLMMSFESVFALLGGVVLLGQMPAPREWLGCGLMFAAILIAQCSQFLKKENGKWVLRG